MDFMLLDVVDVVPAKTAGALDYSFYLIVAATILVEALVMLLMKYNDFGRSLLHALIVNVVSVAAGFLLYELWPALFAPYKLLHLLGLLFVTILIEMPVLHLLNKSKSFKGTDIAAVLMNVISYFLFYLYIMLFTR